MQNSEYELQQASQPNGHSSPSSPVLSKGASEDHRLDNGNAIMQSTRLHSNSFSRANGALLSSPPTKVELRDYFTIPAIKIFLHNCLIAMIPSFITPSGSEPKPPKRLRPTAWLDGLRGIAAFQVCIHHHTTLWYVDAFNPFLPHPGLLAAVLQLPIIRLVWSAGHLSVSVFFVISGYSLSYKPLSLIRSRQYTSLMDVMASSVFRRYFRLCLPPAIITFVTLFIVYLGGWGTAESPLRFNTIGAQLWNWWTEVIQLVDPLRPLMLGEERYYPAYNHHLWTIPVEFQGSMLIFITIIGIAKLPTSTRLLLLGIIISYGFYFLYLTQVLFLSGILVAEIHNLAREYQQDTETESVNILPGKWTTKKSFVYEWLAIAAALFALSMGEASARWRTLSAIILVTSIGFSKTLQSLFTNKFSQYMGRISFALYMVHGVVILTFCWHLTAKVLTFTGSEPVQKYHSGIMLTALIEFPVIFWLSDIVSRVVDEKSVEFAQRLWKRVCIKE